MAQKYSRLESTEEKRNLRNAIILTTLTITLIIALIIFGIPIAGRVANFVTGLKTGISPITSNDKTPPAPPNLDSTNEFTNQDQIGITGSAEPGAIVKLKFNGKDHETLVDKDGNFSVQGISLINGENIYSAIAIDGAGNIGRPTQEHKITLDKLPPDLNILSPADGTRLFGLAQRQVNIEGNTEATAGITINDRIVTLDNKGNFQYPITLNSGDNKIMIKASDPAGNTTEKEITLSFSE